MNNDLISREALKDKLTDTINPNDIAKNEWYEGYAACVQVLSDLIDNAPTVEGRPQGEWVYDSKHSITIDLYECSVCGCFGHTHFNFCPNCGAKMKGSAERPQGEWIIKPKENSQSAILICNKCGHFIQITSDKNFCPNCGAKMKGGKEHEID